MPRLQILHHKSYHPYLEKNKQRVREDEAKAAAEELAREQLRIDEASSSRLNVLRRRAGSPSFQQLEEEDNLPSTSSSRQKDGDSLIERHRKDKARQEKREKRQKERLDFDFPSESARRDERRRKRDVTVGGGGDKEDMWIDGAGQGESVSAWDSGGHINLFADVEKDEKARPTLAEIAKKKKDQEGDPFTMYLGRPDKETRPWYTDPGLKRHEDKETGEEAEERRARDQRKDVRSKHRHDPLTQISSMLASHPSSSTVKARQHPNHNRAPAVAAEGDAQTARISREKAERQRALDLIAKTKAQAAKAANGNRWDDTPSMVAGGRSWADDLEREKDRAGMRFYDTSRPRMPHGTMSNRGWDGAVRSGRSWEV